jgi:hypothetical protein
MTKQKLTFIKKGHDSFELLLNGDSFFSVGDNYFNWDISDAFRNLSTLLNLDYVYEEENYEEVDDEDFKLEVVEDYEEDLDYVIIMSNFDKSQKTIEEQISSKVIEPNSSNLFEFQNVTTCWHCISDLSLTFRPLEIKTLDIPQEKLNESYDLKKSLMQGVLICVDIEVG